MDILTDPIFLFLGPIIPTQIIYPLAGHKNHETSGARTTATKSVVIRRQVEKRELA